MRGLSFLTTISTLLFLTCGLEVPVIDLSQPEDQVSSQIFSASSSVGFFILANHGIPHEILDNVLFQSKSFFDQTLEDKMKVYRDENFRGYTLLGGETLDTVRQTEGDTKEGFYIGKHVPKDHPNASKPLHGPNQWPDSQTFPEWKSTMESYIEHAQHVSHKLHRLIAISFNLFPDYFDDLFNDGVTFLRLLHYPPIRSRVADGVFGAGAHSDYGMLSFLLTDGNPGLQICPRANESVDCLKEKNWFGVNVKKEQHVLIVNLGDMLQRWTNNIWMSTLHRVVLDGTYHRYSAALFLDPNFDAVVTCLPGTGDCLFEETTSGQYLLDKYAETKNYVDEDTCHLTKSCDKLEK